MKVTFYIDVPPYATRVEFMTAFTQPASGVLRDGWKRVAFTVDLPIKQYDALAPVTAVFEAPPEPQP